MSKNSNKFEVLLFGSIVLFFTFFFYFTSQLAYKNSNVVSSFNVVTTKVAHAQSDPLFSPNIVLERVSESENFLIDLHYGLYDNDDVRRLQTFLLHHNFYTGDITGNFLEKTREAVIHYQQAQHIEPAEGYVGLKTRTVINNQLITFAPSKENSYFKKPDSFSKLVVVIWIIALYLFIITVVFKGALFAIKAVLIYALSITLFASLLLDERTVSDMPNWLLFYIDYIFAFHETTKYYLIKWFTSLSLTHAEVLEFTKVLAWPTALLLTGYFFKKVFAYMFFSLDKFNFFGANGRLTPVDEWFEKEYKKRHEQDCVKKNIPSNFETHIKSIKDKVVNVVTYFSNNPDNNRIESIPQEQLVYVTVKNAVAESTEKFSESLSSVNTRLSSMEKLFLDLRKDFAAVRELHEKVLPQDHTGLTVLKSIEQKNADLLRNSGKDVDFSMKSMESKPSTSKTVLVTGGAGFIGFHTAKALLDRGDQVVIVDNFNDYYDPTLKRDRIASLKTHPQASLLSVIELDIADYTALERVFVDYPITHVFHGAAQAGVRYSLEKPFSYERSNLLGFLNMLELLRLHEIKNFVYASSSSVYGANTKTPFAETDMTDRPISLYAATKKANELLAHSYHHLFGINCTGLRFFTVYGPWSRPDMAMLKFAQKIAKGEPIDIYNEGMMQRDFTYIDDIVAGVVSAIDHAYPWEVFNLAYGRSVPLLEYIDALEAALGRQAVRNLLPMQPGDVPVTDADITHAKAKLNYEPKTAVREGVAEFAKWFKEYYDK